MFTAEDVKVGTGSKYQSAGVSEKVIITEVALITNDNSGIKTIQFKTLNEQKQEGQSKRYSLNTTVNPGKQTSGWKVTAKNLLNIIMSATGKTLEESQAVLLAENEQMLVKQLTNTLIGKEFRGLFSSREYAEGKNAIELYSTEPVGGTKLVWDPTNKNHNSKLSGDSGITATADKNDLPF